MLTFFLFIDSMKEGLYIGPPQKEKLPKVFCSLSSPL